MLGVTVYMRQTMFVSTPGQLLVLNSGFFGYTYMYNEQDSISHATDHGSILLMCDTVAS